MGGGLATAGLAAAVSSTGGLGTVGMLPPRLLERELRTATARAAPRPVAANLIVPFLRRRHLNAVINGGAKLVVLSFGFNRSAVAVLHGAGLLVFHQVGTPEQARCAVRDGADGLIAQGIEAGGHLVGVEPTLAFLPRALEVAGGRPVLAAGGVYDQPTAAAAMSAGASAVVAGTRFLLTGECRAHPSYKQRVCGATDTLETMLFGLGWPLRHRVVPNAATRRWLRSGREPAWIRELWRASGLLSRVMSTEAASVFAGRMATLPLSPAPVLSGQSERAVERGPLYAGECARNIESIVPAGAAVRLLDPRD